MALSNGIPYGGPLQFSLDDCKDHLVDLPHDSLRYLRAAKPGIDAVRIELAESIPTHGETAGVTASMHQRFVDDTALIEKLRMHEIKLAKALEVVRETLAKKEHDRENKVSQIVDVVKSTAQRTGNDGILAPFQKTLEYNAQYAAKAAETRRKNGKGKPVVEPVP